MTDNVFKKIGLMYELFGHCENRDAICRNCDNLIRYKANRTYYKCLCYGDTSSEATDWRISWTACGLFNRKYDGKPIIEVKKHSGRKKPEEPMEGQMTLDL